MDAIDNIFEMIDVLSEQQHFEYKTSSSFEHISDTTDVLYEMGVLNGMEMFLVNQPNDRNQRAGNSPVDAFLALCEYLNIDDPNQLVDYDIYYANSKYVWRLKDMFKTPEDTEINNRHFIYWLLNQEFFKSDGNLFITPQFDYMDDLYIEVIASSIDHARFLVYQSLDNIMIQTESLHNKTFFQNLIMDIGSCDAHITTQKIPVLKVRNCQFIPFDDHFFGHTHDSQPSSFMSSMSSIPSFPSIPSPSFSFSSSPSRSVPPPPSPSPSHVSVNKEHVVNVHTGKMWTSFCKCGKKHMIPFSYLTNIKEHKEDLRCECGKQHTMYAHCEQHGYHWKSQNPKYNKCPKC